MKPWYERAPALFEAERQALALVQPLMRMTVVDAGLAVNGIHRLKEDSAVASGTYFLRLEHRPNEYGYKIAVVLANNHPVTPPELYCNDPRLPIGKTDRHIERDGQACIGVHAAVGRKWQEVPNLVGFCERLIDPFLVWQLHYDEFGFAPSWGQEEHGKEGIIHHYGDLFGLVEPLRIVDMMKLLATHDWPRGHNQCPCGSGKRLRECHGDMILKTRQRIPCSSVAADLKFL